MDFCNGQLDTAFTPKHQGFALDVPFIQSSETQKSEIRSHHIGRASKAIVNDPPMSGMNHQDMCFFKHYGFL